MTQCIIPVKKLLKDLRIVVICDLKEFNCCVEKTFEKIVKIMSNRNSSKNSLNEWHYSYRNTVFGNIRKQIKIRKHTSAHTI